MIQFCMDENDKIQFQLYFQSKSKKTKYRRLRNIVLVPIIYLLIAFIFSKYLSKIFSITFIVLSILWLLIYPIYNHFLFPRYYRKNIREYKDEKTGRLNTVDLDESNIIISDEGSETKIKYTEVEKIVELKKYFYIFVNKKAALIFPKDKIPEDSLNDFVNQMKLKTKNQIVDEKKWKWI